MGSARRLLLVAASALAIAADARTDAALSTLTLAPEVDSLITTRDDSSTTSTATSTGVIGSATSDISKKVTETPTTETPATTAPTSVSDSTSASDSGEEEATDAPSSATATVSTDSTSDRSSTETQSETAGTSSSTASSASSKSSVDTLNDKNETLSTGGSTTSMGTILPVVFGTLACVGAIVMAVIYKKKRDANYASEENRPSSDCEYASGADFTPENRTLNTVQEGVAAKVPGLVTKSSADLSAAIADFTTTNSSGSSPFGGSRCKARISSPVPSCYSSSETNMEFQEPAPRHNGGSNVVLTIDDIDSTQTGPQVQL